MATCVSRAAIKLDKLSSAKLHGYVLTIFSRPASDWKKARVLKSGVHTLVDRLCCVRLAQFVEKAVR